MFGGTGLASTMLTGGAIWAAGSVSGGIGQSGARAEMAGRGFGAGLCRGIMVGGVWVSMAERLSQLLREDVRVS